MLIAKNFSVRYKGNKFYSLFNISFEIKERGLYLFVGRTGSGKSTLARAIAGLIPRVYNADIHGSLNVFGINPVVESEKIVGIVGYLSQNTDILSSTNTVFEEIALPLINLGFERDDIEERVFWILNLFNVEIPLDKYVLQLSSGQKQIVMLMSTLVIKPKVLVLDEPFARLDPISATRIAEKLLELTSKLNIITLVFEHHLDEIFAFAKEVYILDKRILLKGKPKEIISKIIDIDLPLISEIFIESNWKDIPITVKEAIELVNKCKRRLVQI